MDEGHRTGLSGERERECQRGDDDLTNAGHAQA